MEQQTTVAPEALLALGREQALAGDPGSARSAFERARSDFRATGNDAGVAECDRALADLFEALGKLDRARQHYQRAATYYRENARPLDRASVLLALSRLHRRLDQLAEARKQLSSALRLFTDAGDESGIGQCAYELARILLRSSRFADARDELAKVAAGSLSGEERILFDLVSGSILRGLGNAAESEALFVETKTLAEQLGRVDLVAEADFELGTSYAELGDWARAELHFDRAGQGLAESGYREREADRLRGLANVFAASGRADEAETLYREARRIYQSRDIVFSASECDLRLGNLCMATGRTGEAEFFFTRAGGGFVGPGSHRGQADAALGLANVWRAKGEWVRAEMNYLDAWRIYDELALNTEKARCDIDQSKMWRLQSEQWTGPAGVEAREKLLATAAASIVPAALFADAGRFTLKSSAERRLWAENIAALSREEAFAIVDQLGRPRMMAELISYFRATGRYETPAPDAVVSAPGTGRVIDDDLGEPEYDHVDEIEIPLALTASATAGRLLGLEGFPLTPPPYIRTAFGTVALVSQLRAAELRYGLASKAAVAVSA
ncbi:MAG: tetratricopeptide repeat protein [Actinomycetota bacterium]